MCIFLTLLSKEKNNYVNKTKGYSSLRALSAFAALEEEIKLLNLTETQSS